MNRSSIVACVAALLACGPAELGSRFVKSEKVLASQGAVIRVDEAESPELAGTSLVIEPGALELDTTITLEVGRRPLVEPSAVAGPVAVWGPPGTRFIKPAQLAIPFQLHE